MSDRPPEAWETSRPAPFLTIVKPFGTVSITALGEGRQRVVAIGTIEADEIVVGFPAARDGAHVFAARLT